MIVRTVMVVDMGDGRIEYVDSKVYNAIMHEGYKQGRAEAIDEFLNQVKADYELKIDNVSYTERILDNLQFIAD